MIKTLREAMTGAWSMLVGLKVTTSNFFQPTITVHYPRETVDTLEGFRGHIELVCTEDDPLRSKCITCGACAQLCPSNCITVRGQRTVLESAILPPHPDILALPLEFRKKVSHPAEMHREPESFHLDYNYCSLCGLCVQNCPAGAIRFSSDVYLASEQLEDFQYDLLVRMRAQAGPRTQGEPKES
ncbi:NADH-quinone oxidoreductase subunit I [Desulfonatronum thiosulfatophilum]|uniref:NADH-quinone oxidoreductase subunit I n=1 Tax=Desulfonatronum thiosulfatophilum TaxID=617002 RepID=A0A1G6CYG8_9BACT|nr:4Fe-4S binding protein [Desulfonatronum thiosulfatophilum]SDB37963.1 NADH-quinone oxidoreductase subunit I [Desulfonatronum thiosulfatophilum]